MRSVLDVARIVDAITRVTPHARLTRIVAIDGYGGSGKSEFADRLANSLDRAVIVHTDDFARPNVLGWEWERMCAQVLEPLQSDRTGRYQRYDWATDKPAEWHDVPVGGTLIIEGVSSLREELGRYWDFAIWLDCPYEVRLERGVARDGEAMRSRWTDIWIPEEDEYVRAQRPDTKADVIIDGTAPFKV